MKNLFLYLAILFITTNANGTTILDLSFTKGGTDSISICISKWNVPLKADDAWIKGTTVNGKLKVTIPDGLNPQFVQIFINHFQIGFYTLIEPGDSIHFDFEGRKYIVSGHGSEKWLANKVADSIYKAINLPKLKAQVDSIEHQMDWLKIWEKQMAVLERFKPKMSALAYTIASVDYFAACLSSRYNYLSAAIKKDSTNSKVWIKNELREMQNCFKLISKSFPDSLLGYSYYFPDILIKRTILERFNTTSYNRDIAECMGALLVDYSGSLRERIIFELLIYGRRQKGFLPLATVFAPGFSNQAQGDIIKRMLIAEKPGTELKYVNFTDEKGKSTTFEYLKGNVVLLDFWYTGCVNCIEMHHSLDSMKTLLRDKPFKVVTISIDTDEDKWKTSIKSGRYTNSGNINLRTGPMGPDHEFIRYYQIALYPTLMLLGQDGKLVSTSLTDPRVSVRKATEEIEVIMSNGMF